MNEYSGMCVVILTTAGIVIFAILHMMYKEARHRKAISKKRLQRVQWDKTRFPSGEEYSGVRPEGKELFKQIALGEYITVHGNGIGALWRSIKEPNARSRSQYPRCHVTGARKWRFVPFSHISGIYPIGVTHDLAEGHKQFTRAFQIETEDSIVSLALFEKDPERRMTEFRDAVGDAWDDLYDGTNVLSGEIRIRQEGDELSWMFFGDVYRPIYVREPDYI